MATPHTRWKGVVVLFRTGLDDQVTQSPYYEFTCPGDATSFSIAEAELEDLWKRDGRRVHDAPGAQDAGLTPYLQVEPLGPA